MAALARTWSGPTTNTALIFSQQTYLGTFALDVEPRGNTNQARTRVIHHRSLNNRSNSPFQSWGFFVVKIAPRDDQSAQYISSRAGSRHAKLAGRAQELAASELLPANIRTPKVGVHPQTAGRITVSARLHIPHDTGSSASGIPLCPLGVKTKNLSLPEHLSIFMVLFPNPASTARLKKFKRHAFHHNF